MRKSIAATAAAITLAAAAWLLQPIPSREAAAQPASLHIHAVDIDVVPGQIDNYLAALKENGAASVKEPGCREFDITVSQKDANHVFISKSTRMPPRRRRTARPNTSRNTRRQPRTWSPSARCGRWLRWR